MEAPEGLNAVEFSALRVKALNGLSEYAASRSMLQDVDTGNLGCDAR